MACSTNAGKGCPLTAGVKATACLSQLASFAHPLAEDDPKHPRAASTDIVPAMRCGAIHERAVSLAHLVDRVCMAKRHFPLQHIKELHLAGLDADLIGGHASGFAVKRRDHRSNLALEQSSAE